MTAKCSKESCNNEVVAKGLCSTHYRSEKVKLREEALKEIIERADAIAAKRPDLTPILADLTKDAKMLFRDFQPKKANLAEELAALRAEVASLKAAQNSSKKVTRSKN